MAPSPPHTAPPLRRAIAKLIDIGLIVGIGLLAQQVSVWGVLITGPLILLADALPGGSLGKRLLAVRVVTREGEAPHPLVSSILRNLPLALPTPLAIFSVIGWILFLILLPSLYAVESAMALFHPEGLRLGDRLAGTRVVEVEPDEEMNRSGQYMTSPDL